MNSDDRKKVLITGGCGFVGRHLIQRLNQEPGNEIWIVDDLSIGKHPASWEFPMAIISKHQPYRHAEVFDIKEQENLTRLVFINSDFMTIALSELKRQSSLGYPELPRFDEIYHLASVVGGRATIDGDPLSVGIDLAIDASFFLWAAKINRPGRILYASSSAVYPVSRQKAGGHEILKETMVDFEEGAFQPDNTYGWSKLTGEYLTKIAVKNYELKVAVVRPFSGYGEDQDLSYPVPAIGLRVAARQDPVLLWGSGDQGRDFVHIDDCVDACVLVCRKIEDGSAVNIGTGRLITFRDLAKLMAEIEGYCPNIQGVMGKPTGVAMRCGDPERMTKKLNWEPSISLVDGMTRVLKGAKARLAQGISPEKP